MRTPAGVECPYFYGDYRRGKKQEECRLLEESVPPQRWTPDLCRTCPVPGITRANACPHLILSGEVHKSWLGLVRRVKVTSYCKQSQQAVTEPHIGCGQCHPIPSVFMKEHDDPDAAS